MRDTIRQALMERREEGGALPSIRDLARLFGASPQTVHKAVGDLAGEGVLHVIPRKGVFWGPRPESIQERIFRVPVRQDVRERLLADLRQGVFHPHRELPSRKELARIYGTSARKIGSILDQCAGTGDLVRRGRSFLPPPPLVRLSQGVLLVVVRCDAAGRILLESEREVDFLKSVRREALEHDLRVLVVGYHERPGGGALLDPRGAPFSVKHVPGVLVGCIVSTWLVLRPRVLLSSLRGASVPIAVWWEHPRAEFPTRGPGGAPIAGFDLSFGKSPGLAVGRRLVAEGFREAAYLSPYHDNDWSRARLLGLREAFRPMGGEIHEYVDERFQSHWQLEQESGSIAGARRRLRRILAGFLADPGLGRIPAWVVVNDIATVEILDLLRESGRDRPRLVSFDSASASESLRFDSFEFHTDGMVRRMFHHVFHPDDRATAREPVLEMVGRLVLRS